MSTGDSKKWDSERVVRIKDYTLTYIPIAQKAKLANSYNMIIAEFVIATDEQFSELTKKVKEHLNKQS